MSSKLKKCSSCGKFIQENKLTLINNKFVCNACKSNNIKLEKKTPEIKVRNKPVIVKDMVALNKSVQKNNKSPNNNKCTHVVENDKPEIVCHKQVPWEMDDTKKEINNCIKEYIDQNGNKKKYDGWVDLTTLKSSRHPNGNPENKQPDVTPDLIIENAIMDICRYDLTRIGIHTFDKLHKLLPNITKETYDRVVSNLTGANIFKSPENFKKYNDIVTHSTNIKAMVIGDIHGTHTKVEVLNLIKNVIKQESVRLLIIIGHHLDDDYDICPELIEFTKTIKEKYNCSTVCITNINEARIIAKTELFKNVALCGKYVQVGDIYVYTQNQVGDYTIYPYDRLNQIAHNNNVVVSGHRVEYTQRTSCQSKFVATCGCLCDPHVYRPIKYKKYETGKQSMNYEMAGSAAYNKKMEFSKHWEKGFIIIDSKQNKTKITQHEIKFSEEFKQYATNVNYKIYTSDGQNYLPTKSTLVLADIHAPAYNIDALNRVDQYVKNRPVKFDNLILLGDTADCRFVNPHEMQKTRCANENALVEFESYEKILKRFEHYCDKKYIMFGNHEDFINRWTDSHKQFKDLFEKLYTDPISKYGYTYIKDKDFINIDNVIYSHGDMKCFGASGSNLQKHLKTLGGEYPVVIGHSHRPQKYQNGTSVPSLCDLNQQYNEVNASNWKNGFTVVNSYGDLRFVSMHLF